MRAGTRAYVALRDDIVEWRLAPGAVLAEVEQAERLGLSRTPVREAIARLTSDGLARSVGARGTVVAGITREDVVDLFDLRLAVETHQARLAAQRRDRQTFEHLAAELAGAATLDLATEKDRARYYDVVQRLDDALTSAADSAYLARALDGVRLHLRRLRRVSRDDPERLLRSIAEHQLVVRGVLDGDELLATSATSVHLKSSLTHILAAFAAHPAA